MRAYLLLALLIVGCKETPAAQQQMQRPPGEVGIVTLKTETTALNTELPGRTTPSLVSELRPQVSGIVKARLFTEGTKVKQGQVLYQIDPQVYRAAQAQAQADLASARASLDAAKIKNERFQKLSTIEGVSKQEADDARAGFNLANAAVAQKEAALAATNININFTQIVAPISGTIGKSSVTAGALVTANQPEPLATIRSLDPIYVDVTESSEERLRLRARLNAKTISEGSTAVKLLLPDGSTYDKEGKLEFAEVAVDEATGMVTLRAVFPNPEGLLLPGMYVRAVIEQGVAAQAILAPQQGISHDAKGNATAMVVNDKGMVEPRVVTTERAIGDKWLIASGLKAGDKLIVEGLNKIGPGMPVHATEVGAAGAGSGAPPPGAPPAGGPPPAAAPAAGSGSGNGSGSGSGSGSARAR